jgi:hypothetical protein
MVEEVFNQTFASPQEEVGATCGAMREIFLADRGAFGDKSDQEYAIG